MNLFFYIYSFGVGDKPTPFRAATDIGLCHDPGKDIQHTFLQRD